jgi:hypothetical protein
MVPQSCPWTTKWRGPLPLGGHIGHVGRSDGNVRYTSTHFKIYAKNWKKLVDKIFHFSVLKVRFKVPMRALVDFHHHVMVVEGQLQWPLCKKRTIKKNCRFLIKYIQVCLSLKPLSEANFGTLRYPKGPPKVAHDDENDVDPLLWGVIWGM